MAIEIERIAAEGRAAIDGATTSALLEDARVGVLGRSAPLTLALRGVGALAPEERGPAGKALNDVRRSLEAALTERAAILADTELEDRLAAEAVDVTLPGRSLPQGRLHLLTAVRREIEDVFLGLGYAIAEGPEVETAYYNFTALNTPPGHPSWGDQDTLWITDTVCLRTQTSPVQVRAMEAQAPPLYAIAPGRCYRRDTPDATHSAGFLQVEGIAVDEGLTLADLKGTLEHFARALFGADRETRLRGHFFPFTEPSVELDVSCFLCDGRGCRVCKQTGWIELLGAGMIDPNVFGFVPGYDPERYSGFAFGLGIERTAMLRHGIQDIRLLYGNDMRLLEQFAV
jgi:phenylalanyl-tRNA synthetase alpha chain